MRALNWSMLAVLPWLGALESPELPLTPVACAVSLDVRMDAAVRWGSFEWRTFERQVEDAWAPRDVDVCWTTDGRGCDGVVVRLTVEIVESWTPHDVPPATIVVGRIVFDGDMPRPEIRLSLAGGRFLVARTLLGGRRAADWPQDVAEHLLPVVMGHALAHELGHFLFRSKAHTRTGLMAAAFRPADVSLTAFGSRAHGPRTSAPAARSGGCLAR
jgi:hypothetical protein